MALMPPLNYHVGLFSLLLKQGSLHINSIIHRFKGQTHSQERSMIYFFAYCWARMVDLPLPLLDFPPLGPMLTTSHQDHALEPRNYSPPPVAPPVGTMQSQPVWRLVGISHTWSHNQLQAQSLVTTVSTTLHYKCIYTPSPDTPAVMTNV